jgi:tetratricopeptide (TPR) repeat protein
LAVAVVFALLAGESESLAAQFAGPEALWSYVLAHNPSSWLAHNNLGDVWLAEASVEADPAQKQRLMARAIAEFQDALAYNPISVDALTNLGFAYELNQQPQMAMDQYQAELRVNPRYAITQFHLAHLLESLGRAPEAIEHYQQALRINPQDRLSRDALKRLQAPAPH